MAVHVLSLNPLLLTKSLSTRLTHEIHCEVASLDIVSWIEWAATTAWINRSVHFPITHSSSKRATYSHSHGR
jgi:hypothetical protein